MLVLMVQKYSVYTCFRLVGASGFGSSITGTVILGKSSSWHWEGWHNAK